MIAANQKLDCHLLLDCEIHSRAKDVGTATANWFAELLSPNPWFAKVVPNVSELWQTLHDD
jgi:hypothetical protein